MCEDLETLKENIKVLKDELLADGLQENGKYNLISENLEQYFFSALKEILNFFHSDFDPLTDFHEFLDTVFDFRDLKTSFNAGVVREKFDNIIKSRWDNLGSRPPMLNIYFSNSNFTELKLSHFPDSVFRKFRLKNSEVDNLHSSSHERLDIFVAKKTKFFRIQYYGSTMKLRFVGCEFSGDISFAGEYREEVRFLENCVFDKKRFSHVNFNNAVFDTSTEFSECNFFTSPKFHETKFHSDTSFHRSKFHDVKSPSAVGDYRTLKQDMHALGAEHDSMMFHALEMEARRNTILPEVWKLWHPKWHETFASWFLKLTTNYGRNFWLPCIWLLISLFMYAGIYQYIGGVGCNLEKLNGSDLWMKDFCVPEIKEGYKINVMYSFQRFWGPLGLIFDSGLLSPKTFLVKLISISQFILSSVLWFILVVQIRRQFRL